MKNSNARFRRLILGMSIEDAQSKFDSPEVRKSLRLAHERYNKGIYQELQVAQRARNRIPPEQKCFITRFTKPSVRGFQAYAKGTPDDFIVREVWPDEEHSAGTANPAQLGATNTTMVENRTGGANSAALVKVNAEIEQFKSEKRIILSTLGSALETVAENVLSELEERRQSGSLVVGQASMVDRLVGEVSEATDKGYKSLSSSTHLLEPVQMTMTLFGKKEKEISDAFKSESLSVPAKEGDISYSLWVAGGLVADAKLCSEFPYHIAKYVAGDGAEASPNRLPRVDVEMYFSPELYQLQRATGKTGITALRAFIGKTMMKQHEPTPVSQSILLNSPSSEKVALNLYSPFEIEGIQIPWVRKTKTKVSTLTGVVFSAEDSEDNASVEQMKEAVSLVWRTWGHLVKDLHVHGDLDYLYVSIDRQKEVGENDEYISEVRQLEEANDKRSISDAAASVVLSDSSGKGARGRRDSTPKQKKTHYVPVSTDFTVVECLLERNGLPHNMVMEDITKSLNDLQSQAQEMQRLALLDELEGFDGVDTSTVVPVMYAPKISVSHAGVIENGTHSFQRIRIRGSSLAHIEALRDELASGAHFVDRRMPPLGGRGGDLLALPQNLSFTATRSPLLQQQRQVVNRLLGHRLPDTPARANAGRFERHQVSQALDYMTVSDDEREFWRENYYRLSDIRLLFHDRVNPEDATTEATGSFSPRLQEHLRIVNSKLTGPGEDEEAESALEEGKGGAKGKGKNRRRKKKKVVEPSAVPPEKMFEYLCTDMEAETAMYDLRVGDCGGYSYDVKLRKIPSRDAMFVKPAVTSVQRKGFVNYFGPARFASYTKMNLHPGLHLLKGEYRAAAHIIVQQFYLDAALQNERKRTGVAFPKVLTAGGGGLVLPDFAKGVNSHRSVAEHGTALQRVLSNALQATALLTGEDDATRVGAHASSGGSRRGRKGDVSVAHPASALLLPGGEEDPCAEAFLNVAGPNVCRILIHEFLSFVWNDIVNQRLQRYGTFAILPGDLVRPRSSLVTSDARAAREAVRRVTRREVESGTYSHWDVLLPIPGANVQLPDNHTTDLYIVTLKRYGLPFNPETQQWGCFYARPPPHTATASSASSPYRMLTSSFALIEEELGNLTPFAEPIVPPRERRADPQPAPRATRAGAGSALGLEDGEIIGDGEEMEEIDADNEGESAPTAVDAAGLRDDLRFQDGNSLQLTIEAGYRTPILNPSATLRWSLESGVLGDPFQRWGEAIQSSFSPLLGSCTPSTTTALPFGRNRAGYGVVGTQVDSTVLPSSPGPAATSPSEVVADANAPTEAVGTVVDDEHTAQKSPPAVEGTTSPEPPSRPRGTVRFLAPAPLRGGRRPPTIGTRSQRQRRRGRVLPLPTTPYWLPQHNDGCLSLHFQFPIGVYPSMMLREITKSDVNSPDVVDLDRPLVDRRAKSWQSLSQDQRATYDKLLAKRGRRTYANRPQAISLALLHQQIFRSGGVRHSLIPTLRSYDSVSK